MDESTRRFWIKTDLDGPLPDERPGLGPCWIWHGSVNEKRGYGYHSVDGGRKVIVHRFAYEMLVGPIPDGLHIDHLCRVRLCVRPSHLEAVTQQENNRRQWEANRPTHCPQGHPFTPENRCSNGRGKTMCCMCNRAKVRAAYRRKRTREILRVCGLAERAEETRHG